MEKTLILGASGGIGSALAAACAAKGEEVVRLSRSADGFDITDEASVAEHLGRLGGPFSRVIVATGALEIDGAEPEKTIKAITKKAMLDQFALNAVLSARVGSIGDNRIGGWISYRSAKAAVNQIVHTAAIELGRTHKEALCVALHPGTVATPFTEKYLGRHPAVQPEEAAGNLLSVMDGLSAQDSGQFFDWAGKAVAW